jgi:hypothetical protein
MDGRKDKIIFVQMWRSSFVARGTRWVKRELCEKTLAAFITPSDLCELGKIASTDGRIVVSPFEMRAIPMTCKIEFRWPFRCAPP